MGTDELAAGYWAGVSAIAGIIGVLVTIVIAILVHRATQRAQRDSDELAASVRELTRLTRRDEVYRQLKESRDAHHLELLVRGGRRMTQGSERLSLERYYFANPAAPLLTHAHMLPTDLPPSGHRLIMNAVLNTLPERYGPAVSLYQLARDLARLTELSGQLGANQHEVSGFVLQKVIDGASVGDDTIRTIIVPGAGDLCGPSLEVCSEYLWPLERVPSHASRINILAGVSLAVLDHEREHGPSHGSHPAMNGFATLLKSGALANVGTMSDEAGLTISVDHAIAITIHAIGAAAAEGSHFTMRALEALPAMIDSFPRGTFAQGGRVTDHFVAGIRLLAHAHVHELTQPVIQSANRHLPATFPDSPDDAPQPRTF